MRFDLEASEVMVKHPSQGQQRTQRNKELVCWWRQRLRWCTSKSKNAKNFRQLQKIGKVLVISPRTSRRSQVCQSTCIWMSAFLTSKHYTTQCMDSFRKSINIIIHLQNFYRNLRAWALAFLSSRSVLICRKLLLQFSYLRRYLIIAFHSNTMSVSFFHAQYWEGLV